MQVDKEEIVERIPFDEGIDTSESIETTLQGVEVKIASNDEEE